MNQTTPVAVVTGGVRRLGRQLSLLLAKRGYDIVGLYRSSAAEARSLESEIATVGGRARTMASWVASCAGGGRSHGAEDLAWELALELEGAEAACEAVCGAALDWR